MHKRAYERRKPWGGKVTQRAKVLGEAEGEESARRPGKGNTLRTCSWSSDKSSRQQDTRRTLSGGGEEEEGLN